MVGRVLGVGVATLGAQPSPQDHLAYHPSPARSLGGLRLGHQFRGDPLGARRTAAVPVRHAAFRLLGLALAAVHSPPHGALAQARGLRRVAGRGTVRPAVPGHAQQHLARSGFAGGAVAGVLHHRSVAVAHGRARAGFPDRRTAARALRPGGDRGQSRRHRDDGGHRHGAERGVLLVTGQPGGEVARAGEHAALHGLEQSVRGAAAVRLVVVH
ncbi:hypothetical protein D9M68_760830 [compost metagenome]